MKILFRLFVVLGILGLIFNIIQIIIIINGGYNRNPAVQPEWLQIFDSISLTLLYVGLSLILILGAIWRLGRMKSKSQ